LVVHPVTVAARSRLRHVFELARYAIDRFGASATNPSGADSTNRVPFGFPRSVFLSRLLVYPP